MAKKTRDLDEELGWEEPDPFPPGFGHLGGSVAEDLSPLAEDIAAAVAAMLGQQELQGFLLGSRSTSAGPSVRVVLPGWATFQATFELVAIDEEYKKDE